MFSYVNYSTETWKIDRDAKSSNEERRVKYREFTQVQAVRVNNL
ncbi:hypothetical protein [Bacillus toyonensis]|nr:hypothetical protein [Bacillus toyonensis]MEC2351210.1 hypothetical protein [Bacillus toyonensis]MED3185634.1 hypothetical protein [Bacillus toyonensis]